MCLVDTPHPSDKNDITSARSIRSDSTQIGLRGVY